MRHGTDTRFYPVLVDIHDEVEAEFVFDIGISEGDHLSEFPGRINVQQGEGQRPRRERFAGQVQHDRRVFADGVQHDRIVKLSRHLPNDMNTLGLKTFEMRGGIGSLFMRGLLIGRIPKGLHCRHSFLNHTASIGSQLSRQASNRPRSADSSQSSAR